jgi:mannitol/fructose-specific phosphotransferase system IIA component
MRGQYMKIIKKSDIKLNLEPMTRDEAIDLAGKLLVDSGYVMPEYIDAMHQRETIVSTYIGNGVAIPHGVGQAQQYIKKSGIVVLQFPKGISYNDNLCYLVIGIAGKNDEHITILSNLAESIVDEEEAKKLWTLDDLNQMYKVFVG